MGHLYTGIEEKAGILTITPEMARAMLQTSPGNRRMRGWYVSQLAATMRRGEWRVTSQGIGIDRLGRLRDAHHRLHAVIEAGIPVRFLVVTGLREDVYEVIDVGMKRTIGDLMNEERRVAEIVRLGASIMTGDQSVTVDQVRPIAEAGLLDCAKALIQFCGTAARYFSSASMRLSACITIMDGGDPDYVHEQYHALCNSLYGAMSPMSHTIAKQLEKGKTNSTDTRDTIARGLKVFDKSRSASTKFMITEDDKSHAMATVRRVLETSVARHKNAVQEHEMWNGNSWGKSPKERDAT